MVDPLNEQDIANIFNDYLGKGHRMFVDNWYTSPALLDFLHKRKTNACGTVKLG